MTDISSLDLEAKCKAILDIEDKLKPLTQKASEIAGVKRDLESTLEQLREGVAKDMAEMGVVENEHDGLIFALQNAPRRVIVTDESKIPDEFFKTTRALEKKKLNDAMKDRDIDGAAWSNGGHQLVIRAKGRG